MFPRAAFLVLALAGCRVGSLDEDIRIQREEIRRLEKDLNPETPIYIPEFDEHLRDETSTVPGEIYGHVVRRLARMTDEEVRSRVDAGLEHGTILADPDRSRGAFVRVEGVIARIWTEEVRIEGLEADRIYAGILFVRNRDPLLFHTFERPAEFYYLKQDLVAMDGIVLKVVDYELSGGGRMRAPFIVGRRLLKYH